MKNISNKIIGMILSLAMLTPGITALGEGSETENAEGSANNTVVSWGFEEVSEQPDPFKAKGDCSIDLSESDPHNGSKCVSVTNRKRTWEGIEVNITDLVSRGGIYTAEVWVRLDDETAENAKFCMQLDIQDSGYDAKYPTVGAVDVQKGTWTKITGQFETISVVSTATVNLYVSAYADSGNTYDFSIDDLTIIRGGNMPGWTGRDEGVNVSVEDSLGSLKDAYNGKFLIGTARSSDWGEASDVEDELIKKHFDIITPTNDMKPDALENTKGRFTWGKADYIIDKSKANGVKVHGHVLAWHEQTPDWFNVGNTTEDARKNLEEYIKAVTERYNGDLYSLDVVNEAIGAVTDSSRIEGFLRQDIAWHKQLGFGWVAEAFKYANQYADKNTKLYYNDFNIADNPLKADAAVTLIKSLSKTNGVRIDGVGMQGHFDYSTNLNMVEDALKKFKANDIHVSISEMDVTYYGASVDENGNMSYDDQVKQAQKYAQLMQLFIKYSDIVDRVTFWGIDDGTSWRSYAYPLLFDKNMHAKQAFYAVLDPDGYLEDHPITDTAPRRAVAVKASTAPQIDGEADKIWDNVPAVTIDKYAVLTESPQEGYTPATAEIKTMWDEDNIYMLIDVTDSTVNKDNTGLVVGGEDPSIQEGIKLFLDEKNDKQAEHAPIDDSWIGIDAKGDILYGVYDKYGKDNKELVYKEDGYIIELKLPFKMKHSVQDIIGFDFQVMDDTGTDAAADYYSNFHTNAPFPMDNTSLWGELVLSEMGETCDVTGADVRTGYQNSIATAFQSDTLNNSLSDISFDKVKWEVTSSQSGETQTGVAEGTIANVTLASGARTWVSLIVDGLYDLNATAKMYIR